MERQTERSILLVEDDPALRQTITEMLEEEGYNVLAAANGEEGLALLQQVPLPGLILLDLMMPTMNGWELHRQLQDDPMFATIPIVVLSAVAEFQRRRGKLDVAAMLGKPVDMNQLLDVIDQAYHGAAHESAQGEARVVDEA